MACRPTVFVVAGERSGEELLVGLMKRMPHVRFVGVAGELARAHGMDVLEDYSLLQVTGVVDALHNLPKLWGLSRRIHRWIERERPAVLLTIDAPSFNTRLVEGLRRKVVVIHWVCPQVWAWRKHRIKRLASLFDELWCLFPFEAELMDTCVYTGHPAAALHPRRAPAGPVLLLPGSRPKEVRRLWPAMEATGRRLQELGHQVMLVRAPNLSTGVLGEHCFDEVVGLGQVRGASAALCASGTATLQLACLGIPMVVVSRLDAISHWVATKAVTVPWTALPNLLVNRQIVPEFHRELDPNALVQAILAAQAGQDLEPVRQTLLKTWAASPADRLQRWLPS